MERICEGTRWKYLSATKGPCIVTKVFWDYYKWVIYNGICFELAVAGQSIECPTMNRFSSSGKIECRRDISPPASIAQCFQSSMAPRFQAHYQWTPPSGLVAHFLRRCA
jgi:hypothetical protein